MKKLLIALISSLGLLVFLFTSAAAAQAQSAISQGVSGKVMDSNGETVSASIIYVQGTSIEVNTDEQGIYNLRLAPGTYQMSAYKMNHVAQTQSVTINENQIAALDFILQYHSGRLLRVPQDYQTIQTAVNEAQAGDTVIVAPGTYNESVSVRYKNINLIGSGAEHTTINANGGSGFFVEHQDNPGYVISGFKIINCDSGIYGEHTSGTFTNLVTDCRHAGYWAWYNTPGQGAGPDPQIRNNVFRNSLIGLHIYTSNPYIINNIIENTTVALFLSDDGYGPSFPKAMNNILVNNQKVLVESPNSKADTSYNNLWQNTFLGQYIINESDINADPLFVQLANYLLQPGSSSIDAGNPETGYFDIPQVGQGTNRNDQGIYGGLFTNYADATPPEIIINSPSGTVTEQTVPVNVSITDALSGVESFSYNIDGQAISNSTESLNLTYYQPGSHTLTVTATDKKGNTATKSSSFVYAPTASSLTGELNTMYNNGDITKLGNSLFEKLNQAQVEIAAGNYSQAQTILQALINQIQAQIDVHIAESAGNILISQIQYLMNSLSQ